MKRNSLLMMMVLLLSTACGQMAPAGDDGSPTQDQGMVQGDSATTPDDSAIVPDQGQVQDAGTDTVTIDQDVPADSAVVDSGSTEAAVEAGSDAGMIDTADARTDAATPVDVVIPVDSGTPDAGTPDAPDVVMMGSDSGTSDSSTDAGADVASDTPHPSCSTLMHPTWIWYTCANGGAGGCEPPDWLYTMGNDAFILANCGACGNACPGGEGSGWQCGGGLCIPPPCHGSGTSCTTNEECCTMICTPSGICGV